MLFTPEHRKAQLKVIERNELHPYLRLASLASLVVGQCINLVPDQRGLFLAPLKTWHGEGAGTAVHITPSGSLKDKKDNIVIYPWREDLNIQLPCRSVVFSADDKIDLTLEGKDCQRLTSIEGADSFIEDYLVTFVKPAVLQEIFADSIQQPSVAVA